MKHLLLLFFFSGSLDGFSQVVDTTLPLKTYWSDRPLYNIDTQRATLAVYYTGTTRSILHTMPGFVVRRLNKENVYLDDRKKVIKKPLEVWDYKIKK